MSGRETATISKFGAQNFRVYLRCTENNPQIRLGFINQALLSLCIPFLSVFLSFLYSGIHAEKIHIDKPTESRPNTQVSACSERYEEYFIHKRNNPSSEPKISKGMKKCNLHFLCPVAESLIINECVASEEHKTKGR